ncbi:DUF2997 domain-containing protein [Paenarthrobacter nitroguajacolicus]|uniref:DUF2997 domain-containing protein n=1 Tax=Paenarthrobacter nitroguajacolicus TaxID=211146 RepID=A0A558H4P2_PAENT|nr:DUF2997 domain-containing protein [Paenarthrobacter nitroguajacolicus]TVU64095.1 DUF2997 domain-containing protein [Paenarthrobacter nitroguajacolicus]
MMRKKIITFTVAATGAITAEAHGPGPSCADELAAIQALLPDAVIADSRLTPAYFQAATSDAVSHHQYEKDNGR